ncbi:MAG: cupredoxin domain-containing protein [Acidimicrobiales bacterium]
MKKGAAWAAALALVVLPGACGGSDADSGRPTPAGPPEPGKVILRDIEFKPDKTSVKVGDTVTWKFEDKGISHDVVADDGSFKSEVMDSGTFRHTFDKPGTYPYRCSLHPVQMKGTVTVG